MEESVEWNGQTLYAPLIACRPVRLEDYPADRLALHQKIVQESGAVLSIYPGSVYQSCGDCGIEVAVGPRQQETMETASGFGLTAYVLCFLCAATRVAAADEDDEVVLGHLGNPFKKA